MGIYSYVYRLFVMKYNIVKWTSDKLNLKITLTWRKRTFIYNSLKKELWFWTLKKYKFVHWHLFARQFFTLTVRFFWLFVRKGVLMPFFRKSAVKSRKVHSECSLCMCRYCMALRRQRTTCDSLIKVSTSVLKRYNFCLYSFKYRLFFDPWKLSNISFR